MSSRCFLNAMASPVRNLDHIFNKDSNCPICLEEYFEPKVLPCFHNICKKCLKELMHHHTLSFLCPICRAVCPVPERGVDGFPTNVYLVRLIRESPAKKVIQEINKAVKECGEKLVNVRRIYDEVRVEVKQQGEMVKKKIHEDFQNIIDVLRKQEEALCSEVDSLVEREETKHPAWVLITQTEKLLSHIGGRLRLRDKLDIANDGEHLMKRLRDANIAFTKLSHLHTAEREKPKTLFEFAPNKQVLQCVSGNMFGSVTVKEDSLIQSALDSDQIESLQVLKPGTKFYSLNIPQALKRKFQPFAVAMNDEGNIAVSDQGNHTVLLYSKEGEFIARIGVRGSNQGSLESPTGVTFLTRHLVAIADGCLFGKPSRIQVFDSLGRFTRCLIKLTTNSYWLTRLSTINNEQLAVTCIPVMPGYEPCVKVFDPSGLELLSFGNSLSGKLLHPVKAVVHDNQYFVSDVDKKSNRCMVSVFDERGKYLRSFGECMLKKDPNDHEFYPLVIALDDRELRVLAYSGLNKLVRCYMPNGSLESYYSTLSGVTDMAVTGDGRVFVVCSGNAECPHSVQVIFHI
ncbi:uncharacterized protein LOC141884362 [Acropora palmata]|uniref:uncharacterized protein LOC141884362 n=1 Tax=Acropora palmata TaxID=6131 RepID=UPI003DA0D964